MKDDESLEAPSTPARGMRTQNAGNEGEGEERGEGRGGEGKDQGGAAEVRVAREVRKGMKRTGSRDGVRKEKIGEERGGN